MTLAARLARFLLVVALLAGWQAALEHPVSHHDEHGGFVHGTGKAGGTGEALCDALATVATAVAGAPTLPLFAAPAADALPQFQVSESASAPALAYRSQAPPQVS